MVLWRAVDDEAEVLDMLVQKRQTMAAAFKLLGTLLEARTTPIHLFSSLIPNGNSALVPIATEPLKAARRCLICLRPERTLTKAG